MKIRILFGESGEGSLQASMGPLEPVGTSGANTPETHFSFFVNSALTPR